MFIVHSAISLLALLSCASNNYVAVSNYQNELASWDYLIEAVEGNIVKLPCDLTPLIPGDKVNIVVWYKNDQNGKFSPIYTFDSRDNILLEQGKHWSDELVLGDRARFRFQEEPAKLTIDSVLYNDAGVYQCRVDFKRSPTRNSKVNLTVIIPPEELIIFDEKGIQVNSSTLGPYNEGTLINLTCIATGGTPVPKVTWWQENVLLDDSCEDLSGNRVQNILHMERLQRKHLHTVLTCQASNNDFITPVSTSVRLDLNLRPLAVQFVGIQPLADGRLYQLECEVRGSRPAPKISVWKGNTKLTNRRESISEDGNITTVVFDFKPSIEDEGKYLICRVSNSTLESRWDLTIFHTPLVNITLGSGVSNNITEGSDVYFHCNVKANPSVYRIEWKHNGTTLFHNITGGIIISNYSLVIQDVDRNRAGFYTCKGHSTEGEGESDSLQLDIQLRPLAVQFVGIQPLAAGRLYKLICEVRGSRPAPKISVWKGNTKLTNSEEIISEDGNITTTWFDFKPSIEDEGKYLICRVSNSTLESRWNLTIFHTPLVNITLGSGVSNNITEGSDVYFHCNVKANPRVYKIEWKHNGTTLFHNITGGIIISNYSLVIQDVDRNRAGFYTCKGYSTEGEGESDSLQLDIQLRPLAVQFLGGTQPLAAGRLYQLACEVRGSRPAPKISVWKGNTKLTNRRESISEDGNITTTWFDFQPSIEDEGKYLICRVSNSTLESRWDLTIDYTPLANITLGSGVSNNITEGSDVYFHCNVKANPRVYKIVWKHNDKTLFHNINEGIIMSNYSLVIQNVDRHRAGFYTCKAYSVEGEGESDSLQLDIQFLPVCRSRQSVTSYELYLYETVQISCELEANPMVTEYIWMLNSTQRNELINFIPLQETTRTISYTPKTKSDYGPLLCKGVNSMGEQQNPCIFHIILNDKPQPLSNCSLRNQTHDSLIAVCAQYLDGGLNQTFVAEVYNSHFPFGLLKNLTSEKPVFIIDGLDHVLEIKVNLYVANKKGRSATTHLDAVIPTWVNPPEVLLPPENCYVTSQTRFHLSIKCQAPKIQSRKSLTYLLQVYDANSRTLVGTSTSRSLENITVTAPLRDYQDLVLFVRVVVDNSVTSNATILYAPAIAKTASLVHRAPASAPIKFRLTPTLAITIGVVSVLVLVSVALLAANRLFKGSRYDDKDDGGLSTPRRRTNIMKKTEGLERNSAQEDEKNPDVIPIDGEPTLSRTYVKIQDADDISANYVINPEFSNLKGHAGYHCTDLANKPEMISQPCMLRPEHFPVYKPEKFKYVPKTLPKEVCVKSDGSNSVLEPLLMDRGRIPMMLLPQQQLTATQL